MVLIETIRNDYTTFKVIEWFDFFGVEYISITPDDILFLSVNDYNGKVTFRVNGKSFNLNDITGYWFRRGLFSVKMDKKSPYFDVKNELNISSYHYSCIEKNTILDYFHYLLSEKKSLNSFLYSEVNKLVVLHEARKKGFLIPKFLLTDSKNQLEHFFRECNGNVITKVCSPMSGFETANYNCYAFTQLIDMEFIKDLGDSFYPSYFQENIEKNFEVRTFLLNGKFYSMAIFSQESNKTAVDFRNYDTEKPNRCVPFNLPIEIEEKLLGLCNTLNLNSGSIDFICSKSNDLFFLEINPVGQFGMVSSPCNYHLEREVALYFKN